MRGRQITICLGILITLGLALPGFPAKPGRPVYVQATFRDAINEDGTPFDKMRSDGQGSYVSARYITAQITAEGELDFSIDASSGRRAVFIYDDLMYTGSCAELPPDTVTEEPVTFALLMTNNGTSFRGPQVNLLGMRPGDSGDVLLWACFQTALRSGTFYSKYNVDFEDRPNQHAGIVRVTAACTDGDGQVERWIFSPLPGTESKVNLHRTWQLKSKYVRCDMGCYKMPFELVIDRL